MLLKAVTWQTLYDGDVTKLREIQRTDRLAVTDKEKYNNALERLFSLGRHHH
jgi:hypothetical protein